MIQLLHRFLLWAPPGLVALLGGLAALYTEVKDALWSAGAWAYGQASSPAAVFGTAIGVLAYGGAVLWTSDGWQARRLQTSAARRRPSARLRVTQIYPSALSDGRTVIVTTVKNVGSEDITVDGQSSVLTFCRQAPDRETADQIFFNGAQKMARRWIRKRGDGIDIAPDQAFLIGRDQPIEPASWQEFQEQRGLLAVSLSIVFRTIDTPRGHVWVYEFMASLTPTEFPSQGYRNGVRLVRKPWLDLPWFRPDESAPLVQPPVEVSAPPPAKPKRTRSRNPSSQKKTAARGRRGG